MLHEARKDLSELDFTAFLSFFGLKFMLDEIFVEGGVE